MPKAAREKTETALLKAGHEVVLRHGFANLSLRRVAQKAGVNLGMFPYLFGTKEEFVRRLAQSIYEDFFREFSLDTSRTDSALANLRQGLIRLGRTARDLRQLIFSLVVDIASGHGVARKLFAQNAPRHGRVILGLIQTCQREGRLARVPVPVAIAHLAGTIGAPMLFLAAAERAGGLPVKIGRELFLRTVTSDSAIEKRVDLALRALTTKPGPVPTW